MCDNCFPTEIDFFKDKTDWTSFDNDVLKKREQGQIKYLKLITDSFRDKDDVEYIYECMTCGQKWRVREPWQDNDGYLLRLSNLEQATKNWTTKQKLLWGLIAIILWIVIDAIYWLWTH